MQCAATHSDQAVVVSLNAVDDILIHRRTDLTNVPGESRTDLETQFSGQNRTANNGELRKRVLLTVELDRLGDYPFEELVISGKPRPSPSVTWPSLNGDRFQMNVVVLGSPAKSGVPPS